MTLRVRILVGYGSLVALLLLAAGSAMLGFFYLSAGIDALLEKNFTSIRAAMEMIESLERQDSITLAALVDAEADTVGLEPLESSFLTALARCEGNVTEEEEPAILAAIGDTFAAYRQDRDEILASPPERPLAAYDSQVFPRFTQVKAEVVRLLAVNQQAMYRADHQAKQSAVQNGAWLGFLVALALVALVVLSRALQRDVLSRLEDLRHGLKRVAAEPQRRLRDEGRDELSAIARHVNTLLEQQEQAEARFQGRLSCERRLLLGLMAAWEESAELYDLSGQLIAGDDVPRARHRAIGAWIADTGKEQLADDDGEALRTVITIEDEREEEKKVELRLLRASGRPGGWLATAAN